MPESSILVTGGCGYIGSHVVRQLSECGYQVVIIDNLSTGSKENLIYDEKLVVGDISDSKLVESVFSQYRFDAVFHFAASIIVPESVKMPLKYYRNNTVNSINIFDACIRYGVNKIVFSSTAAVYGENELLQVTEDSPLNPTNPYARSKLMDEYVLSDMRAALPNLSYVILRYFNVAGSDLLGRIGPRNPNATHLIKVACEAALGIRDKVTIFGTDYPTHDGTCIRDYIHVEDLAKAHLESYRYLRDGGDSIVLNCGYGRGLSVREVLKAVELAHRKPIKVSEGYRRIGDVSSVIANSNRIKKLLNWRPVYEDISSIVESAYHWEKKLIRNSNSERRIFSVNQSLGREVT
ncbi:UDP-glucose 4-epimerase GalE [Pseudobacteriovorax antillogorgiicola]|uniref:UDP-glucose 4-epimerase n=1 Tax=Pseudobacteriovorax antillogorgiicola TaxID=1513793 RepID=A0A1Y6CRZ2_9BACT|nr:UDP-glucose 4-epimerase GalE [Pseudobacteriovorax antillogorgiicola]TCS45243.1 UDP-galactose 4-epimerase [Pseudobacteriovorax antillogorgiicola]SMF75243.1 UDP-galactose 4-epimerase [Pseudobacteriovorax antillogorgiicola]